ncbi:5-guanidino-2-oxopentanoate decarboxylase [Mesorhizobium microcysteis]|uniref:5-guanidino-2-oxopentanoate decarboxylase n=1 Tax=Neoaquamicrobium microcysteis TaxID=2682781 RepID=A0A5D4GXB2_9HYPH|nr:5-guanidino-2-oxopentanoate decarboxylase [Mesorhizobium microcysteis]TYR32897.1 5-guanidino-2-oxopentanoate decarboxylase [Mesorhizobium microcysteis]
MTFTTGQYLTRLLEAYGVDTVFGIPGVHTVELYRGLADSRLRHITPRHEQGAGFMADGYARASGRPGVVFAISGPGMTNIMTAMAQAYADSIPMLVISTVNAHGRMGSGDGWLHELPDQQAMAGGVTAFSRTVHTPHELAPALAQAFAVFDGARPRPVHIELPIDVMLANAGHLPSPAAPARVSRPVPSTHEVDAAAAMLRASSAPVILAGGGAVRASGQVRALAEALDAPVVMTVNARGMLPPDHPLAVSLSPSMAATRALIAQADVVLALGTEFGATDYDMYENGGFACPAPLIRVDIDPRQAFRGPAAAITMVGDAGEAAALLAAKIEPRTATGQDRATRARNGIDALDDAMRGDLRILEIVRDALPDAPIVGDSTQLVYAGNLGFAAARPGSWFNSATGFGTLGYALPAATGVWLGGDGGPVVALAGDGGLQFTMGELASAAQVRAKIVLLLHDNSGYGEIKSYMVSAGVPPIGVDLLTPDFIAVARACGWTAKKLASLADLNASLATAAAGEGPTLLLFDDTLRAEARQL